MSFSKLFRSSIINEGYLFVFSFISNIFLVRIIGPEGNGVLVKYLAVANVLVALTSINFENGINYFLPKYGFTAIKKLVYQIIGWSLTISISILVIAHFTCPGLIYTGTTLVENQFAMVLLFIIGILFLKMGNAIIAAQLLFKTHRKISFNLGMAKIGIYILFYLLIINHLLQFQNNTQLGLGLYLLFIFLTGLFTIRVSRIESKEDTIRAGHIHLSNFLKFTLPIYISYNLLLLFQQINYWIIDSKLDTELLGIYGLAFTLSGMPFIFTMALRKVLYPILSKGDFNISDASWIFRLNAGGMLLIVILLFVIAPWIIQILYGLVFIEAVWPFRILIWATFINSIAHLFSSYNEIQGLVRLNIMAWLVSLLVLICIGFVFIPKLGIQGAAIAYLLSSVIGSLMIISFSFVYGTLPKANYFIPSIKDFRKILSISE